MKTQLLDIRKFWLALAILTPIQLAAADSTSPTNHIAIKAPHLVNVARGEVLEKQIILVEDGVIKAVGAEAGVAIPDGTTVLDLGKSSWVLPGLIDCHTHLTSDVEPGWENTPVKETVPESALRGARNALLTLQAGFTTVRDVGAPFFADVALMRAIEKNWIAGPRMFPAGNVIGITGGHADVTGFNPGVMELGYQSGIADGVDEIIKTVRYQIKHGAKVIKFCATAGVMSFEDSAGGQQYSEEEMRALIQEAHRHGLKVAAHAHGAEGIKTAVRAGVDSIEHGSLIDEEGIALMKARGTWLVPTIFTWYYDTNLTDFPEKMRAKSRLIDAQRKEHQKVAISSGVKVAFGTDAGTFPHGLNAGEFKYLVEYGLTPMQAIQCATINAAELLGQSEKIGSIEAGKLADLIAVRGDPLKDINVLKGVGFVMKEGVVYKDKLTSTPEDLLRANIDASVNPGEDFFEYANAGWLRRNPIPASESAWGIGKVVREELYLNLRKINEQAMASVSPPGSEQRKIADFWTTAMDAATADQIGLSPLQAELERITSATNVQDILAVAFGLQPLGIEVFFSFAVSQDEKSSDVMSVHLAQGGLGLPERDFYFNPEQGVAHIREEYVAHIARTLKLLGREDAAARIAATNIMSFETELAKASRKLEDLRDPVRNYNKMTPGELTQKHTPAVLWTDRLNAWLQPSYVIVGQPEFFSALDRLLTATPVPVLQDYLRFHLVVNYAPFLSKAFDDEHFAFYSRVLSGQKEQRPRWKRVLDAQDAAMGMVVGKIFVKEYFPESAKERYSNLVQAIRTAYQERIERLDWMSDATKAKAQQKLSAMAVKVGYPDKWKDYSALVVGTRSYCENMMNAARWRFNDMISKFGKPVDRTEWDMTPQTYNAYYKAENNEIVLPAAVFAIPGIDDSELDDAVVYGYAGASTIGHEITHGFDDEGRQFDAAGNLKDWWTTEDEEKFKRRAEVMVQQFDAYQPLSGLHINGRASLGENIADHGGVLLGLDAFKKTEQYRKGEKISGLTPLQRFFLGYALSWLFQEQEARLRQGLLSDVHAPAKWRVLGPLANIPEFYEAFGVRTNQPMWRAPEALVRIW